MSAARLSAGARRGLDVAGSPSLPESPARLPYTAPSFEGEDLGRIISLSDGVFAFALTLLVISLTVPTIPSTAHLSAAQISGRLGAALQSDYPAFVGYAFAFFLIANWWLVHHRMFASVRRYDMTLVWVNIVILLEVAAMPFVLSVYSAYSDTQVAVALFAGEQGLTGATFAILWWYATENHRLVDPALDRRHIRYTRLRGVLAPAVFGLSIAVSFVNVTLAEFVWIGVFIGPRVLERHLPD
jgi:uncharacterized membrane protein